MKEAQERKKRLETGSFTRYVPPSKTKKNTTKTPADSGSQPTSHLSQQSSKQSERLTEASHRQFVRRMKYVHVGESSSSSDSEKDDTDPVGAVPVDSSSDSEISSVSSDDEMDGMIRLNQSVLRSGGFMNHLYVPPSSVKKQVLYNDNRCKQPTQSNKRRDATRDYVQRLENIQQRKYVEKLPMYTYDERASLEESSIALNAAPSGQPQQNMLLESPRFQGIAIHYSSSDDEYDDGTACMSELETIRSRVGNLVRT